MCSIETQMNEHKQSWLKSIGYQGHESVIDCDPERQTITFQTPDGPLKRQVVECWTRVMGYHRPTTSFNIGKRQEYRDRVFFKMQDENNE